MSSLSEDETKTKYETKTVTRYERPTPSAPYDYDDNSNTSHNISCIEQNGLMEQTRKLLEIPDPDNNEGLLEQTRQILESPEEKKKSYFDNNESDEEDDDPEKTVEPVEDDDYQRPAKLDLVVGFLRFSNFLSCSTSVFAVILSILFPLRCCSNIKFQK